MYGNALSYDIFYLLFYYLMEPTSWYKIISWELVGFLFVSVLRFKKYTSGLYPLLIQETLEAELATELGYPKNGSRGHCKKTYAVMFLDAIHYKIKQEGYIVNKAVYMVIGVDMDGCKDVLGMYIGEHETSKF